MIAALIGCAAAPPAQQEEPAKPIRWRSIFTVQSDGGKFRVQVLDEDLTIRAVNGIVHIMQDDLNNTYDLCADG